ncbi:MAG: glycosyl-4,4'-diaponeurosporenoate acyltransferase [Clostridiaceae bacterium]|nr:glycosyl-4,4'-diaponeurosporenoate acyltransferase [Clostridiaceae bacterium]
MRIIFLPDTWTIGLCFLVWTVFQVGAALVCLALPNRFFNPEKFIFRAHCFEQEGRIYEHYFRVKHWKYLLPDGGAVWKKRGFRKRKIDDFSKEYLNQFLIESARGELSHWLAILPFWAFGFFTPPIVPWLMLIYALLINIPCIMAQRYNRPRVKHILNLLIKKGNKESDG